MIKATKKNITLLSTMFMGPISLSLLIISVYIIQPKVEAKLTSDVKSVLQQNNIPADISFSGRDGVLKGEVASQEIANNAEKLSLNVFGTRTIRNQLNVKNTSQIEASILNEPAVIEEAPVLANKENVDVATLTAETKGNNQLSEVDKIMANMQQQALLKPKYKQPKIEEEQAIEKSNVQLVSIKTLEKTTDEVAVQKADNKKEQTKPVVVIAMSNNTNSSEQTTTEKKVKSKEPKALLDIIDDFNTFLEPSSVKETVNTTTDINKGDSSSAKTLDNIDLSTIHFSDESTTLSNESYSTLDQISQSIKAYYHAPIDLIIYANDSDIAYARGVAIRDYLAKKGVERSKISVAGHTITAEKGTLIPISIKLRK